MTQIFIAHPQKKIIVPIGNKISVKYRSCEKKQGVCVVPALALCVLALCVCVVYTMHGNAPSWRKCTAMRRNGGNLSWIESLVDWNACPGNGSLLDGSSCWQRFELALERVHNLAADNAALSPSPPYDTHDI